MKPGWQSSEFGITALMLICGTALVLAGKDDAGMFVLGGGVGQAVNYTRGRQSLKEVEAQPKPNFLELMKQHARRP